MPAAAKSTEAYAYESITVSTAAISLTSTKVVPTTGSTRPAFEAYITVEATNALRYRMDGTAPTSSEGHALAGGGSMTITGTKNLQKLQLIRSGGADAIVKVTYFR